VLKTDWEERASEEERCAAEALIDHNAEQITCPACGTTFPTGPAECPECGLALL
jgi:DNA-directed RNA polymerase subunit RPC12/RpoP